MAVIRPGYTLTCCCHATLLVQRILGPTHTGPHVYWTARAESMPHHEANLPFAAGGFEFAILVSFLMILDPSLFTFLSPLHPRSIRSRRGCLCRTQTPQRTRTNPVGRTVAGIRRPRCPIWTCHSYGIICQWSPMVAQRLVGYRSLASYGPMALRNIRLVRFQCAPPSQSVIINLIPFL